MKIGLNPNPDSSRLGELARNPMPANIYNQPSKIRGISPTSGGSEQNETL